VAASRRRAYEIAYYEGLIRKTAAMYAPHIQDDYEDIVSVLRIKVWRSLETYDPARSRMPVERYVFSCVKNQVKDLLKRKRRNEVFFHDVTGDCYEEFFISVSADVVYADVEQEIPVIPNTLTSVERETLLRLYTGASQREVATAMGYRRSEIERIVRSIREKMEDWRPATSVAERQLAA
jgi:RNA polymerase sigma factor (sigma-70 family)